MGLDSNVSNPLLSPWLALSPQAALLTLGGTAGMPALSQASEIRVVMPLQGTFSVAFPGVDALNVCVPFYDGTNSWNFYQDRIEHNGKKLIFGGQATTDGTGHYTINDAGITATTSLMIQPTGATLVNYLITSQGAGSAVVYTNSPNIPFNWLAFNA